MTMADTMLIRSKCWRLLLCIVVYVLKIQALSTNSSIDSLSKHEGLVLKLVHKDSIYPPKYPPGYTLADRINSVLSSSRSRVHYLGWRGNQTHKKLKAPIISSSNTFLAQISIGKPPVRQWLHLDTGSDLLWIQCNPCTTCHQTQNPLYDPKTSRSFSTSSCDQPYCKNVPGGECDEMSRCKFDVGYLDGSQSTGYVGFETLLFEANGFPQLVRNVLFGCASTTKDSLPFEDGVLGLSGLSFPLVSLTDGKFSYCLGNISDPNYSFNRLALGNEALLEGRPVPLKISPEGYYLITLEGINIGRTQIPLDPKDYKFNVIIDSGSTVSYLKKDTYVAIKSEVERILGPKFEKVRLEQDDEADRLCYHGLLGEDLKDFPPSYLLLGPKTEIILGMEGMFWRVSGVSNIFCLAIEPTPVDGLYVIGASALQFHNTGFDTVSLEVFFTRKDCSNLA